MIFRIVKISKKAKKRIEKSFKVKHKQMIKKKKILINKRKQIKKRFKEI